ncbi:hypothetical protein [Photobacterium sp. 53610]|uniref:hypothetical protein n=1 Tax=Photobacterium sp. 53610 TaxID=3102789 RepID=UPI002EDA1F7D
MSEVNSPAKDKKLVKSSLSVGGVSAVVIAACNIAYSADEYLPVITTAVPILIGGGVWGLDYLIHFFGFKSKAELAVHWKLHHKIRFYEKRIKKYEKSIKRAQKLGICYQSEVTSIDTLKHKINEIELAYGNVDSVKINLATD